MNENKYCKCASGYPRLRKRLYIRKNTPIPSKTKTKYTWRGHIPMVEGYKRSFVAIGWICLDCNEIVMNNQEKHIPFKKYHKLEFDYNQLLENYEKYCMEEK